jgi:hypothetical protein
MLVYYRIKENCSLKLPLTICDEMFAHVKQYCDSLEYNGPLAISCDDTKLLASLRLYWSSKDNLYFLVGGIDRPESVEDPDKVFIVMNDPSIEKGTKVSFPSHIVCIFTRLTLYIKLRLWISQIPLPGMTPFVVVALPITSMKSTELYNLSKTLLDGLMSVGLMIVSYASDGTETE